MATIEDFNYTEVTSSADVGRYLDNFRGGGVAEVLRRQFIALCQTDEDQAVSALGNFIDHMIDHQAANHENSELKDDFIYHEIKAMTEILFADPEFEEYQNYLQRKLDAIK